MARTREFDVEQATRQAMRVFWRRGYQGASLSVLLAATGLSKSSFYEAFGSKQGLLLAALRRYVDNDMGGLVEPLSRPGASLPEIEETLARLIKHSGSARGPRGCLINNCVGELGPHDAAVSEATSEARRRLESRLEEALRRAKQDGSVTSTESPEALARFLAHLFSAINLWGRTKSSPEASGDVVRIALQALK